MANGLAAECEGVDGRTLHQVDGSLSATEIKLINKLASNGDVRISVLFRTKLGRWPRRDEHNRYQQQVVGAVVSRVNRKIADTGRKIVPGEKRQTYRIIRI